MSMSTGQLIPVPADDPLQMAFLDTNDLGNAERLVRLAKGLLLWVDNVGWISYDTKRWSTRDGDRRANQLAHEVARHIDREASALNSIADKPDALESALGWPVSPETAAERVTALHKHAIKSGDASRTAAMLAQAKTLLTARLDDFDTDKLAFNLQNGTLRFLQSKEGGWESRLDSHDPRDMIMQLANFTYEAGADCPQWVERLALIQPQQDQRRLLQMLFGYCLTGLTSEQKWFIFQGRGGDGKSLTITVIGKLLGDYYRHAGVETFIKGAQRSGADHSSDLARLQGDIRLVTFDEPERNQTWNGGRLKQVTGGKITCRPLRQEEVEYYPRWKVIGEVNPLPAVPSDDDGFWRRCWVIPFPYQFDKGGEASEPFELVEARMMEEASGILNWMIAGVLKWLETRRLPSSLALDEAVLAYRQSASPIGEWLMECCDLSNPDAKSPATPLFKHFEAWCANAGIDPAPKQAGFGRALRDRQLHVKKDPKTGNRWRKGITLRPDAWQAPLADETDRGGGRGVAEPRGPQDEADWRDDPI